MRSRTCERVESALHVLVQRSKERSGKRIKRHPLPACALVRLGVRGLAAGLGANENRDNMHIGGGAVDGLELLQGRHGETTFLVDFAAATLLKRFTGLEVPALVCTASKSAPYSCKSQTHRKGVGLEPKARRESLANEDAARMVRTCDENPDTNLRFTICLTIASHSRNQLPWVGLKELVDRQQ